jgi:hypothetical protein
VRTSRPVKVLGEGDLTVALKVTADSFSKSAREKIEKAGGTVTWIGGEPAPKEEPAEEKSKAKARAPKAEAEPSQEKQESGPEAGEEA